jgi:hypothetical protein
MNKQIKDCINGATVFLMFTSAILTIALLAPLL